MRAVVRFLSSGPSLLGLLLVGLFFAAAIAAPTLAPDYGAPDAPPGLQRAGRAIDRTTPAPQAQPRLSGRCLANGTSTSQSSGGRGPPYALAWASRPEPPSWERLSGC